MTIAFYIFFASCIVWAVSLAADTNPEKQATADALTYLAATLAVVSGLFALASWNW